MQRSAEDGLEVSTADAVDRTVPDGRWQFDDEVANVFDNILARSIPQYETMRKACTALALRYAQPGTDIVDLGCSRGGAIADLIGQLGTRNRFIGIDVSEPMLAAARSRFAAEIEARVVDILAMDLRREYPSCQASVTLSVLTIQFTPIEHRQEILEHVYNHTVSGGAFVMVEKVIGATAALDSAMVDIYYDHKKQHGYSQDQIERKRLSLEGVLVPLTARWNEDLLAMAGFREVDCFWRWMNFAGWLARKM